MDEPYHETQITRIPEIFRLKGHSGSPRRKISATKPIHSGKGSFHGHPVASVHQPLNLYVKYKNLLANIASHACLASKFDIELLGLGGTGVAIYPQSFRQVVRRSEIFVCKYFRYGLIVVTLDSWTAAIVTNKKSWMLEKLAITILGGFL